MTGDHRGTAEAIAREVGLPSLRERARCRGTAGLRSDELKRRLATLRVISRVSPLDKMMIVKTLQEMGEVVAMTGDGVNDAPSIRQADIGIAMGSGTEVSRDVADLVLLDDNFETIVAAVEEGRQILKNIRKVLVYLLSSVFDELLLIGGALRRRAAASFERLTNTLRQFFLGQFSGDSLCLRKGEGSLDGGPSARGLLFDPVMRFLILLWGSPQVLFSSASTGSCFILDFRPRSCRHSSSPASEATRSSLPSRCATSTGVFSNTTSSRIPTSSAVCLSASHSCSLAIYFPPLQSVLGTVALPAVWLSGVVLVGLLNMTAVELGKALFRGRA